jgi:hypothetical protein
MTDELATVIDDMRLRAQAALLRRLDAGSGFADPRVPAQIYLRDAEALARLAGGTLRPQGTHRRALDELERAIGEREPKVAGTRLGIAIARLGLGEAEAALLALALAYALDLDVRELAHALAPRRRPALHLEACADVLGVPPAELIAATVPGARLRRSRLITVDGDGLAAAIELAGPALAWMLGDDNLQPPVANVCEIHGHARAMGVELPEHTCQALDTLLPRLDGRVAVVLRGPRGSGRSAAAARLTSALGHVRMVIDVPALIAMEKRTQVAMLGTVLAAARLRDAMPYLADGDALYDEAGRLAADHADALEHHPGLLIVGTTGRGGHLDVRRPQFTVAISRAELSDRERAWQHALTSSHADTSHAAELAARYVIGPGAIADIVREASLQAQAAGTQLDRDTLEAAVARRLSLRIGSYGAVVSRKALMSELILPDDVIDTLRDMIAMVRERAQILERWGYQRHLGISRGVSALYSGEPGTGKTMAASVVASELGLELVRIDLSAVVSKYVGETEKNLAKIFDEAQDAHAMLLFDEADSLFGKRTELKTAQDRFANLEINYILQRMETFDGVSVLTTNAESAIDPALQRRLNFRIRFPEPDVDERAKLWRQLLPPQVGLDGVDFQALAERFDMTGGYIKNAVVRAAVIAARAGRALAAEDLWLGAHHEYVEMGKVMPQLPLGGP